MKKGSIVERLAVLETLMNNHLAHHEKHENELRWFVMSIGIGIAVLLVDKLCSYVPQAMAMLESAHV